MHKLIALFVTLLMIAMNSFAAVNVNTASDNELQMLSGIGPAKAKAIIDYRTKNGEFKSVDDLAKVPGIGPSILGKIKGDVTLTGPTTAKATAAAPSTPAAKPAAAAAKPAAATPAAAPVPAAAPAAAAAAKPVAATAPAGAAVAPAAKAEPAKK